MSPKQQTFRVTLIWPPYASPKKPDGSKQSREVFPNCTSLVNENGHLQFTDSFGKRHYARMSFHAEEEK